MTSTASDKAITIQSVLPETLHQGSTTSGIREIYKELFSGPPYYEPEGSASAFVERLQNQTDREGWRLLTAEQNGPLLGFVYGYISRQGQWWHDRVTSEFEPALVEQWFEDSFVLVEFGVRASARGQGIGSRLHDAILNEIPNQVALTMTHQEKNPVVAFYLNRGWQVLRKGFRFHGRDTPRLVLVRERPR